MTEKTNPGHDSLLIIGGEEIRVHRSFDLVRRIEQRFGPIMGLISNIRVQNVSGDDLLWLIKQMITDGKNCKLSDEEIIEHIEEVGVGGVFTPVTKIVLDLFAGNKEARKILAQEDEDKKGPLSIAS